MSETDPIISRLAQVEEKLDALIVGLEAPIRFYVQATGILGALRWLGSGTLIFLVAAVVWYASR